MRSLVISDIKKSFDKLIQKEVSLSPAFVALAPQDPAYEDSVHIEDCLSFRPELYLDGKTICCAQVDFLGFYVLQQSVRQLLKSINFSVAGDLLASDRLYAPAITSHYTAAFHALHSLLALEGHVFYDVTYWPLPSRRPNRHAESRFVSILTKHNRWVFERRSRNHQAVWSEVAQVYKARVEQLPVYFSDLFDLMYQGQYEAGFTLDDFAEALENRPRDDWSGDYLQKFRVKLSDHLSEFLDGLRETRHRSVYESFGEDPHVVDGLINRDIFSSAAIENQAKAYGQFCESLMGDVASDVLRVAQSLTVSKEIAVALFLTTCMGPFDKPRIDQIRNSKLRDVAKRLHDWLFHPAEQVPHVAP